MKSSPQSPRRKAAFTVIELMVVVSILALLVAISMSAFAAAVAQAKISRTKVVIAKLDQLVMERYESYRTRPVPLRAPAGQNVRLSSQYRLNALREIMRMELPCSKADVETLPTVAGLNQTAIVRGYIRRAPTASWTDNWEAAECLYLIVASMRDGDKSALDFFTKDEIGDVDGDGVREILDAWGQPIVFIRWAPGYMHDAATPAVSVQRRFAPDGTLIPDSFDLLKVDSRWSDTSNLNHPIDLKPLIYSFGPDKNIMGIQLSNGTPLNDPYRKISGNYIGTILDATAVADNISNHYQEAE